MIHLLVGFAFIPQAPAVVPVSGLVITKSCRLAKGDYLLAASEKLDAPAITIRGDGITVDFGGTVIRGTPQTVWPDQRKGLCVSIAGKNVTIKSANIHGYRVAVAAIDAPGVRIVDSDFSYNWGQHLYSTAEAENGADWEHWGPDGHDEWMGFGAAIYLRRCPGFEVKAVRATGGHCGLLMGDCDKGLVWNCDFSFLSGGGIGLYHCCDNRIMHNKADWCVRGYSYAVYNRGQDSAGIFAFGQCYRNVYAYNSATHGGDGFFTYTGGTPLDEGKGGSNHNLLYGNDFSHSPANAIESTYNNYFIDNLLLESWHGLWPGYEFDTETLGNVFAYNGESISIFRGPRNHIAYNLFDRENTSIECWGSATADQWDPQLGPGPGVVFEHNLFEDTSYDVFELSGIKQFAVRDNVFRRNGRILWSTGSKGFEFTGNRVFGPKENWDPAVATSVQDDVWTSTGPLAEPPPPPVMDKGGLDLRNLDPSFRDDLTRFDLPWNPWPGKPLLCPLVKEALPPDVAAKAEKELAALAPKPLAGGMNPFLPKGTLRGRRYILITEWGPYDFRRPLVWARESGRDAETGEVLRTYEVLGPKGVWRLRGTPAGVNVSATSGPVPGKFTVRFPAGGSVDLQLSLEYVGARTVDERGVATPAGTQLHFGISEFHAAISWHIGYHPFDPKTEDPVANPDGFERAMRRPPIFEERTSELNWAGRPSDKVPVEYYGDEAIGTFTIPAGDYVIKFTSDDGVRAWLDGKPILTNGWHHEMPTTYAIPVHILGGEHTLKVDHFQQDGYAALRVAIERAPAAGS